MAARNEDFRPNPARGVFINSAIEQDLLDRITPTIVALQAESREPISVYIDSPGGSTLVSAALGQLLRAPSLDFAPPCRLITVVTSTAASAAADLLSSGDYAIAYPESTVYFHGVRTFPDAPVTREYASELTQYLRVRNDSYALALARRSISRIIFLHLLLRTEFDAYREETGRPLSDLDCFTALLARKCSPAGAKLVQTASGRNSWHDALMAHVSRTAFKKRSFHDTSRRTAELEADLLKSLVDFEMKSNPDAAWTFRRDGLARVTEDFLLLIEFLRRRDSPEITQLCTRWAEFFLTDSERKELASLPPAERAEGKLDRVRAHLQPLWFFCVSLCQALQEGENELPAEDAYWLGLVDEVLGASHLPSLRILVEHQPDTPTR